MMYLPASAHPDYVLSIFQSILQPSQLTQPVTHQHYIHAQLTYYTPRVIIVLRDSCDIVGANQLAININGGV